MSLFVNPAQFGDAADLDAYPRDEAQISPSRPRPASTSSSRRRSRRCTRPASRPGSTSTELGAILEGEHRPGHFRGVATVCLKLFTIVRPDLVYFGQKDAQQVAVLRRMVADLALELELRALPTVRDADGLALSSRNARLSPAERERALALPRALATPRPRAGAASCSTGSRSTTSRSPPSTRPSSRPRSASAPPA